MRIGSILQKVTGATASLWNSKGDEPSGPPVLREANRFPYGPFQFKTQLAKGIPFEVHASADLRNWNPIAQGTGSGDLDYLDSEASKFNHRFYRLIAGDLPSANILGYSTTTLPPGFSMISNPFDASSNSIADLFKDWPDGTTLSRFDVRLFRLSNNQVRGGKWTNPSEQLPPTDGALFFNPTSDYKTLSFAGEVVQGNLTVPIPGGFSVRSSLIPQSGALVEDLDFPIADGDVIHLFDRDRQQYVAYPYQDGKWKSGAPVISIGEAFWVAKTSPDNWTRTLNS